MGLISIFRSFDWGKERKLVISSFCLVILILFYLFVLGSAVELKTYVLIHRVTYENVFNAQIINLHIDSLILLLGMIAWCYVSLKDNLTKFLIIIFYAGFVVLLFFNLTPVVLIGTALTLPSVSVLLVLDRLRNKRILYNDIWLSSTYIAMALIGLAAWGIISLLLFLLTGTTTVIAEKYPYDLYQKLFSIPTPLLMIVLVFCIPFKVILNELIRKLKLSEIRVLVGINPESVSTKVTIACLSVSILLGICISLIPHLLTANPNSERLGVDTARYVEWLAEIKKQNINPIFFVLANPGDRPLTLIVLYLSTESLKLDPIQVIEYSPLLLTSLLVLATFALTRQLTQNDKISVISAFLSAISFQTLIGIYSGFYANWLAIILGYLAFSTTVKYLKKPSKFSLALLAVLMTGILLAHVYTWSIVISVAFVFLFVLHRFHYYPRKQFILLYLIISSSIAIDVLKSSLTGSSTGLEADVSLVFSHGLGISETSERLKTLADTVQTYYAGIYANIAILGLVMYWLIRCKIRELSSIFLLIFLSSATIPLFLGDWILQSRVLYNIPFQIPAAIALYSIWKQGHKLIFVAIILIISYLSLHVLANLGYVPPTNPLDIIYD